MSIKSSVRSAISAIDDNRPADAKSALSGISGDLASITSSANSADGDNSRIKTESTEAQSDMARDVQTAQTKFINSMNDATRTLNETLAEAQDNFSRARTAAEDILQSDLAAAQTTLNGHVSDIQGLTAKVDSSLNRIKDLAS